MLRDLRVKIRNRYSRIASCSADELLPLTKQFFQFIKQQTLLESVINELMARHPKIIEEANTPDVRMLYGDTDQEAAALGYTVWSKFASQNNSHFFTGQVGITRTMSDSLNRYRSQLLAPLFDYLDEVLEDGNIILATLTRYKHKVEWYRREELQQLFTANQSSGENVLAKNMYEYLFDQGIPFHVEPKTASGRPDVVALEDTDHPFIGDAKIFDASNRGATYIKKGFYQVYQYCLDRNESIGYLIVFNVSDKQLRLEMPSSGDAPRFEYNHKTIFVIVINIHAYEETASKRPIPETVTITAEEMVRELKEQEQSPTPQIAVE
jgi:hypothetical protein